MDNEIKTEVIKEKKGPHRFGKGNCANPNGRPRVPEIQILREALQKAKEIHGKDFIEHFVDLAYKDKNVAIALAKKLIPDKLEGEGFASSSITNIFNSDEIDPESRRLIIEELRKKRSAAPTA